MRGLDADPANWREDDLERDAELASRVRAWMDEERPELDEIVGEGAAADGQITVTTTAEGRVREVTITSRAMRLDSGGLAAELLLAVGRAQDDAERKSRLLVEEALGELLPGGAQDIRAVEEYYARMLQSFHP